MQKLKQKPVLVLGITLLILLSFLLFLNPFLSLPMDWDMFALVAPVFLVFLLQVIPKEDKKSLLPVQSMFSVAAISLLGLPIFWINANKKPYSERLESIGTHVFKTYYEWSGQQLDFALWVAEDSPERYLERMSNLRAELKPYAIAGHDLNFAHLLSIYGNSVLQHKNDLVMARQLFKEAYYYSPKHKVNLLRLFQVNFKLKYFKEAYQNAEELINAAYPTKQKARRMAIHCALEGQLYDKALKHSEVYLHEAPQDSIILKVRQGLFQEEGQEQLEKLFSR
jgi:hypothetical protein